MEKSKKITFKKSIVRNIECPKPKTVVKYQPEVDESGTSCTTLTQKSEQKKEVDHPKLETPELYSALALVNKMHNVENVKSKKVKSTTTLNMRKKLVIDEKATKLVNFPYNQHIFKDLIPLGVKEKTQSIPVISRTIITKDEEPKLSDFFIPKVLPEYSFQVSPQPTITKPVQIEGDALKLYRIIENWN